MSLAGRSGGGSRGGASGASASGGGDVNRALRPPLSKWRCEFKDPHLERQYRNIASQYEPTTFAALLLLSGVALAGAAALAYYSADRIDVMLMLGAATCVVWVVTQWLLHRVAFGTPFRAMHRLSMEQQHHHLHQVAKGGAAPWLALTGSPAFFTLVIMTEALFWAFVRAAATDDEEWTPSLVDIHDQSSYYRLYSASVSVVAPMAFGLDYTSAVVVQILWFVAFAALAAATHMASVQAYGSMLWAAFLALATQMASRHLATLNRVQFYIRNVVDVVLGDSPTNSSVTMQSPTSRQLHSLLAGTSSTRSSPHSPTTPVHRQPVVERVVSMLNRVRRDTIHADVALDLERTLQILFQNPDALNAQEIEPEVNPNLDARTAAWMHQTLQQRIPSFSAAKRNQDKRDRTWVLQRYGSNADEDDADDKFDGVIGRPREAGSSRSASLLPHMTKPTGIVRQRLKRVHRWDFDVFEFTDLSHGQPLSHIFAEGLRRHNLMERFSISPLALTEFMHRVESEYCYVEGRPNPYHSNVHAADVTQAILHFMSHRAVRPLLDDLNALSMLVAAAVHDFRHPGVNNTYLIATQSKLAIRYSDMSILENFHACEAFRVLRQRACNIVAKLSAADMRTFRYTVIQCILATDLALGPRYISVFESRSKRPTFGSSDEDKLCLLQHMLKCADVSHATRPIRLHVRWSHLISEEFYLQGDTEAELGLPVSPLCDRGDHNIAKSQRGFISFVVRPCFTSWSAFCQDQKWMNLMQANLDQWEAVEAGKGLPSPAISRFSSNTSGADEQRFLSHLSPHGAAPNHEGTGGSDSDEPSVLPLRSPLSSHARPGIARYGKGMRTSSSLDAARLRAAATSSSSQAQPAGGAAAAAAIVTSPSPPKSPAAATAPRRPPGFMPSPSRSPV